MPPQSEPLSRRAKSTHPHVLAKYIESSEPNVASLLRRLPATSVVIDRRELCEIAEYNAQGPVRYTYELYVYYSVNEEPVFTFHTYELSMKHPTADAEYAVESKQKRVPVNSDMYKRLKPLCEKQKVRLELSNQFALLMSSDDDE